MPTANNVKSALNDMADRLAKAGCTILRESATLPDLGLTSRVYRKLLSAFFSADLPPEARARIEEAGRIVSPDDQSLAASGLRGFTMGHAEWIRQSRTRGILRARWQALFQDVDVMLCPPMPTQAFPHDHSPQYARTLDVDGTKIPYNDQSTWAGIAILTGLPSTTMPIAQSDGLPIGMQITGGYLEDRTTISFADLVEREFGGFKSAARPPRRRTAPTALTRSLSGINTRPRDSCPATSLRRQRSGRRLSFLRRVNVATSLRAWQTLRTPGRYVQPKSLIAQPAFQIFVMWRIFSPSNSMT